MVPGPADRSRVRTSLDQGPGPVLSAISVVGSVGVRQAGREEVSHARPAAAAARPKLRGVLHEIGFFVSLVAGPLLVLSARDPRAQEHCAVYAASLTLMLGTSALLHRRTWSTRGLRIMRKLDMAMIFVLIAGTYTAVVGLMLHSEVAGVVLWVVWIAAAIGSGSAFVLAGRGLRSQGERRPSKWVVLIPYFAIGWLAVILIAALLHSLGWEGVAMLVSGGVIYTIGALVYAARSPDPWPQTFGYHEIFHAMVLIGAACHFALVALVVLPRS